MRKPCEGRYVTVIPNPEGLPAGWPGVAAAVMVCRERQVKGGPNAGEAHDYLTSSGGTAEEIAGYVRGHRGVEDGLHRVLDVASREDESRTRGGHAGANWGMLRRVAVSRLRNSGGKGGVQTLRLWAAWDDDFLLRVLLGIQAILNA